MNEITLNEIFQTKGFSNTELILTGGAISPTGNFTPSGLENPTYNILVGVKDGILSFFGGGLINTLTIKNGAVSLTNPLKGILGKIIDSILHPKKDKEIKHLFDIPISNIVEIVPQQKNDGYVVLNICEKSNKVTKLCFHYWHLKAYNIAVSNILMKVFEEILETRSISKAKISLINEDIQEANRLANTGALGAIFKGFSTVLLVGGIVAGATAAAVSRAGKDIGNYPKSTTRYLNTESGNTFDENGNKVPY